MTDPSMDKVLAEEEEEDETKAESPVCCPVCKIVINNDYALAIHQGSVHGVERPWQCKMCGKNFARHLELDNHRRVHSGEKPFQCDVCGARSTTIGWMNKKLNSFFSDSTRNRTCTLTFVMFTWENDGILAQNVEPSFVENASLTVTLTRSTREKSLTHAVFALLPLSILNT